MALRSPPRRAVPAKIQWKFVLIPNFPRPAREGRAPARAAPPGRQGSTSMRRSPKNLNDRYDRSIVALERRAPAPQCAKRYSEEQNCAFVMHAHQQFILQNRAFGRSFFDPDGAFDKKVFFTEYFRIYGSGKGVFRSDDHSEQKRMNDIIKRFFYQEFKEKLVDVVNSEPDADAQLRCSGNALGEFKAVFTAYFYNKQLKTLPEELERVRK